MVVDVYLDVLVVGGRASDDVGGRRRHVPIQESFPRLDKSTISEKFVVPYPLA